MVKAAGDELVDIVDDDDQLLETVTRREMRARKLCHRAVYILVQSSDGRLLVHQRSFDKDLRPGAWDITFGGVVAAGETYENAASRELWEEIGVEGASPVPCGGALLVDEWGRHIARFYHLVHDGPFRFNDGEVIAAKWMGRAEIQALVRAEGRAEDRRLLFLDRLRLAE